MGLRSPDPRPPGLRALPLHGPCWGSVTDPRYRLGLARSPSIYVSPQTCKPNFAHAGVSPQNVEPAMKQSGQKLWANCAKLSNFNRFKICEQCLQTASASGGHLPTGRLPITGLSPLDPAGLLPFPRPPELIAPEPTLYVWHSRPIEI